MKTLLNLLAVGIILVFLYAIYAGCALLFKENPTAFVYAIKMTILIVVGGLSSMFAVLWAGVRLLDMFEVK